MIYSYEIRESDITVSDKYICIIKICDATDNTTSTIQVGTSNDYDELLEWAKFVVAAANS